MKLIEKYPETSEQFLIEKNNGIYLDDISIGSMKKLWWKCDKGVDHIWLASSNQRTSGGKLRGCPVCTGKLVVASNSLKTKFPKISLEWNYLKNINITPESITPFSNKNPTP